MALNDPSAPLSRARSPRLRVRVAGVDVPGFVSATATTNNERRPSDWTAEFAASADPQFKAPWWQDTSGNTTQVIPIEISIKENESDSWVGSKKILTGRLDNIVYQPERGIVQLKGRDRTADFAETKTFKTYRNQTASQIAQELAANHGMQAQVAATTTPVGRYYEVDHDRVTMGQFARATTEWDLLCYLAQHEMKDVFTQGDTLYFLDPPKQSDPAYIVQVSGIGSVVTSNVLNLRLERNLWLAKDIKVVIRSWNSRQGKGFEVTAPPTVLKSSVVSGKADQYVFYPPNLTQTQAQNLANSYYADLVRHERKVTFDMPGDVILTPRNIVQLQGTKTDFDQSYFIMSIERRISPEEGYRQSLVCKNQSPQLSATVG